MIKFIKKDFVPKTYSTFKGKKKGCLFEEQNVPRIVCF